jgi:tRNA A37 methylthiotransferase MiaB
LLCHPARSGGRGGFYTNRVTGAPLENCADSEMMTRSPTCRLVTLGCKVNQYETQYVKEMLEANGYKEAASDEQADLCVVNTCTVTHEADAKGRQLIRRLAQANPGAALIVMGCYAPRATPRPSRDCRVLSK